MIIDFRYIIDSGKVISFRAGDVSYGDDDVIADWLPATEQVWVGYVDERGNSIGTVPSQVILPPFKRSQIPSGLGIENVSLRFGEKSRDITQITKLNTKGMRYFDRLFENCTSLDFSTLPKLDMTEVTRVRSMFYNCRQLTTETLPDLDTSKVTSTQRMFYNCSNLTAIPLLDTSNAMGMLGMFYGCSKLTSVPQLDTSKCTIMEDMFWNCQSLTEIPQLDTSNVTDMSFMFGGCNSLTSVPELNTSNVKNMNHMFFYCHHLTSVPAMDTSKVKYMYYMFSDCNSITSVPPMDTSNVEEMHYMFQGCTNLKTIPPIVAPNCTDFENMFLDCPAIQEIDITTPKATNLKGIFRNCSDLRKVKNMYTGKATAVNNFFSTTATDYKLTEIPTMDFSSCTASNTMNGFFVNRKGIHHMDITGAIHRGCTFYSVFDESTLVQILQACNRTTTTYSKKMAFKDMQTLNDTADGQYAALMAECTDKGWTFTNFTLNPYETAA